MFIQSQVLPRDETSLADIRLGARTRVLSLDPEGGAMTALVEYPGGWEGKAQALTCHEEIFVLKGALAINGVRHSHHCYAHLPAGYERNSIAAPEGAIVLTMYSSAPRLCAPKMAATIYRPELLAECIDTHAEGLEIWQRNPYTRYLQGTGVLPLREDPDTGEISILYAALPFRFMEKQWSHPNVQEMYVLSGSYAINDVGIMRPGAYGWWEPENFHGPYGSLDGFMMFIRSVRGPLDNVFGEEGIKVDYGAPYRPVLPNHMKPLAEEVISAHAY
jgi:hypothetical protein